MDQRIFKAKDRFGNKTEFELIEPTAKIEREADIVYRRTYNEILKEGILPRERMKEELKKQDVWNEDIEKEFNGLIKELSLLTHELEKAQLAGERQKGNEIAGEMVKKRGRMWELFMIQQGPLFNTCEAHAEQIRQDYLLSACVRVKVNGQRYWPEYKDYVLERDENVDAQVAFEAAKLQASLSEETYMSTINTYPEQVWLENLKSDKSNAKPVGRQNAGKSGTNSKKDPGKGSRKGRTKAKGVGSE